MKNAMRNSLTLGALMSAGLLAAGSAHAVYVEAVPQLGVVGVGDSVQVDINIGDLANVTAPSLGAYEFNIGYDASVLQISGISWGDQLDLSGLGSLRFNNATQANGLLNVYEVSFDDNAMLNDLQLGEFTLFSVYFSAVAAGTSSVDLSVLSLADAEAQSLAADTVSDASVSVVPIPAALPLLLSGLLVLAGRTRRGNRAV